MNSGNDRAGVDEIVRLNVGGRSMATSRSTLTKFKDSLLEKMFSEESGLAPARLLDGAFFIDADPDAFSAVLTWLRHGVVDTDKVSTEHLSAAAAYFGLDPLRQHVDRARSEDDAARREDSLEAERRWRRFYETRFETLKRTLEGISDRVKDLPKIGSAEMMEFQVALAVNSLDGGTLAQICRQICLQQLSEESRTAPADILSPVMFALKKMQEKGRLAEDGLGIWHFVDRRRPLDHGDKPTVETFMERWVGNGRYP